MLLSNEWVNNEIKEENRYLETSENEKTATQSVSDTAKTVLKGKFIALQA